MHSGPLTFATMKELIGLTIHLLATIARLLGPGGGRSVIAENLLLKHQLLVHSRSRQMSPNLAVSDRALPGFWTLFPSPRRMVRAAILIKPSTRLNFHAAMKRRTYRLLFSSGRRGKPGPKGLSKEVINAIVAMKRRNPRFGCPKKAQQINLAFGPAINKGVVRRILANHYRPDPEE
jgi:putative transposase